MESIKKKVYRVCPHCDSEVSTKIFKQHRRLYYDYSTKSWTKENEEDVSSSDISSVEEYVCHNNSNSESDIDWDENNMEVTEETNPAADQGTILYR